MASSDTAIESIYAASLDASGWPQAVESISEAFHAATGALYVENHGAAAMTLVDPGVFLGHGPAAVAAYAQHFCALNPFNRLALRYDAVGVLTDTDMDEKFAQGERFADGEYFIDWARPQNIRHVMGRRVRSMNDAVLCAAFWRPADAGPYSVAEKESYEAMIRHVNRALDIGARLQTAEAEMGALLGRGSAAVITLGPNGHIRQCNAVAEALLSSGCALVRGDGRLRAAVAQDQAALDRLLACAFDPRFAAWAENARLRLRRTDAMPDLVATIAVVAHRFAPFALDRTASAVLTVEGFDAEADLRIERLRRRFALTPMQARLADVLRRGRSLREAAVELGIGFETARTHLRAVFARTDTHRQSELVLLLRDLEDR